ncbi:hypothetical protein Glove_187g165 [Diversispora epigaea]|uniref:BED-type domain-containing protein n=1 Tax=Diversispora epigaea TaxID=1348612 RepID=A0A397ILM3_9GLOM|nr:hypothetical protein Glove_187g165 [Diversispora epigaea]
MNIESSLENEDSFISSNSSLFSTSETSFITNITEEIIEENTEENSSNISLLTKNTNLKKRKYSGGRKTGEIWNYFIKGNDLGRGLYEAECKFCNNKWPRGCPKDMKIHLARNLIDRIGETGEIGETENEDSFISSNSSLFSTSETSFITNITEEIIEENTEENSSNISLLTKNTNLKKRKYSGGRKTGEIWNYFIKGNDLGRGLYEAECKFCNNKWPRGCPKDMKIHLARNCKEVSDEIRTFWREIILEEASNTNVQTRKIKQSQITKHFNSTTSLPIAKANELDQAILKAWVCCRFPFQTIENPFIIDLFRIAIPGYNLPSRTTLSDKLLDQETLRIEKKIDNELEKSNYLTISLDGWTSPRHDSIYNYIITTSTRKEYLIKLKSYNIEKQTETFMAEEIQKVMQNIGIENIIGFFNNSHAAHGYYKEQLNIMKIKGGEIQSYCKTRWDTLYTTVDSIIRSKPVFYWILENHPEVITNKNVFTLLQNEEFYSNCYQIASILKPVKELTNILEARNANLADCFIGLIKLSAKINQIQFGNPWKSIIISNYNYRLGEFINNTYILAYWFHPLYRGVGLKQVALNGIYEIASIMWYNLSYSEESCLKLLMEMRSWKRNVAPYNLPYNAHRETPMKWNFSMLKWFFGERRTNLNLSKIESITKIRSYYISNIDKEIQFRNKDLSESELRKNINESVITYDIFEKNGILERDEDDERNRNLRELEEAPEDENVSSISLNINQFVDLTLLAFLSTGDSLFGFTNNRQNTNERSNNSGNMEYDPIRLAQRVLNSKSDFIILTFII